MDKEDVLSVINKALMGYLEEEEKVIKASPDKLNKVKETYKQIGAMAVVKRIKEGLE